MTAIRKTVFLRRDICLSKKCFSDHILQIHLSELEFVLAAATILSIFRFIKLILAVVVVVDVVT